MLRVCIILYNEYICEWVCVCVFEYELFWSSLRLVNHLLRRAQRPHSYTRPVISRSFRDSFHFEILNSILFFTRCLLPKIIHWLTKKYLLFHTMPIHRSVPSFGHDVYIQGSFQDYCSELYILRLIQYKCGSGDSTCEWSLDNNLLYHLVTINHPFPNYANV